MHKVELINFENIILSEIRPPLSEEGMHFSGIRYPTRQLQLYVHGLVAQAPEQASAEYGGGWSFWFQPNQEDIHNLLRLEELLCMHSEDREKQIGIVGDISRYERRETLNENSHLRIKLKADDDGWKFVCNSKLTEESLVADLAKGTSVTLTLAPGFYFSDDTDRYGLYYTLKSIKFPEVAEAPMRSRKPAATKRPLGIKAR